MERSRDRIEETAYKIGEQHALTFVKAWTKSFLVSSMKMNQLRNQRIERSGRTPRGSKEVCRLLTIS